MGDELATSNVNRSYGLAATSIAIFTFILIFLFPRFASGEINALLFQATLVVMGVATFSFVFASLYYYFSSLSSRIEDAERASIPGEAIASGCSVTLYCSWLRASSSSRLGFLLSGLFGSHSGWCTYSS
jgi:hypothetical protein